MKAKVDKDFCTGCGACEEVCPEIFEVNEQGVAVVKLNPIPPEHEEACREAAGECPSEAIEIEE